MILREELRATAPKWRSEDNFFCTLWIQATKSSSSVQAATALTHGATAFPQFAFCPEPPELERFYSWF